MSYFGSPHRLPETFDLYQLGGNFHCKTEGERISDREDLFTRASDHKFMSYFESPHCLPETFDLYQLRGNFPCKTESEHVSDREGLFTRASVHKESDIVQTVLAEK